MNTLRLKNQDTDYIRSVENSTSPVGDYKTVSGFFVIAHRGASYSAPENTMAAFKEAVEMKADMIEMDVLLTRDKIPVVIHDDTVNRTTSGTGPVTGLLSRELKDLDAGSWFDETFRDTRIPLLQSVLKWAENKIALNIEIKGRAGHPASAPGIEGVIIDLITQYNMENHVIISSFSRNAIKRIKQISPTTPTALLNWKYSYGTRRVYDSMRRCNADGINMMLRHMKRPLMKILKENHVPVWIYTLNDEPEMRYAIRNGATGIFTDRPDVLRMVVKDEFLY